MNKDTLAKAIVKLIFAERYNTTEEGIEFENKTEMFMSAKYLVNEWLQTYSVNDVDVVVSSYDMEPMIISEDNKVFVDSIFNVYFTDATFKTGSKEEKLVDKAMDIMQDGVPSGLFRKGKWDDENEIFGLYGEPDCVRVRWNSEWMYIDRDKGYRICFYNNRPNFMKRFI